MELSEFITESLKGIIKGITDSSDFSKESGAQINPLVSIHDTQRMVMADSSGEKRTRYISTIEFDIAVTATQQTEAGVKGGISVLALNMGANKTAQNLNETVSKIKFSLNVCLPNG